MYYPNFKKFLTYAQNGNLIPVVKDLILDCETPVSVFLKVSDRERSSFLLESVEYGEKIGRYSFIGHSPDIVVTKDNGKVSVRSKKDKIRAERDADPLRTLEEITKRYSYVPVPNVPLFCGGFVGYCAYENIASFEDIDLCTKRSLGFPQAIFFFSKELIVFDHLDKKVKIVVLAHVEDNKRRAYDFAVKRVNALETIIKRSRLPKKKPVSAALNRTLKSNISRQEFEKGVRKIKSYIKAGDAIQVVLSQRFDLGPIENGFNVYRALRTVNPSPYMFYFKHKDTCLIGSSPEMLVKKEGSDVQVRPIAGTRKRGRTLREDERLAQELVADEKENAEHLMLVDLGRNDLGRVCEYASISVTDYARVERYSHVMHLVSEVHGRLKRTSNVFDLLRFTFPAGTLTGAPKIRAMQIIDEIEPDERGPYGGCLGYFSLSGDCDMCITIRTIMIKDGHAYLQAGAGIVYDSVPSREYTETINKARALMQADDVARNDIH